MLNRDTANISAFRFRFWEAIEYLEPTTRFPDSKWKLGQFLNVAWDSEYAFIFHIWTTPNDKWKDGVEMTRIVVWPQRGLVPANQEEHTEIPKLNLQKMVPPKKHT